MRSAGTGLVLCKHGTLGDRTGVLCHSEEKDFMLGNGGLDREVLGTIQDDLGMVTMRSFFLFFFSFR